MGKVWEKKANREVEVPKEQVKIIASTQCKQDTSKKKKNADAPFCSHDVCNGLSVIQNHFLTSFFQNNSNFSWHSNSQKWLLLNICVVISSPATSLSSSCLTFLESSSKHVLHERELYFGNSYTVFFLFEAQHTHLKAIFVITSITMVPQNRHSECFCNVPAGPRLSSFKATSFTSTEQRLSVQVQLHRYVQAFIYYYMWNPDSADLVVVS